MTRDNLHGLGLVLQIQGVLAVHEQIAVQFGWAQRSPEPGISIAFWAPVCVGLALLAAGLALAFARKLAGPALLVASGAALAKCWWWSRHGTSWDETVSHMLVDSAALPAAALVAWALSPFRFDAGPRTRAMAAGPLVALPLVAITASLIGIGDSLRGHALADQIGVLVRIAFALTVAVLSILALRELTGDAPPGARFRLWVHVASFGAFALNVLVLGSGWILEGSSPSLAVPLWAVTWAAVAMVRPWLLRWFATPLDGPVRRGDGASALAWMLVVVAAHVGSQFVDDRMATMREYLHDVDPSTFEQLLSISIIIFALGTAFAVLDEERRFARGLALAGALVAIAYTVVAWRRTEHGVDPSYQYGTYAAIVFGALVWFLREEPATPELGEVFA